MTRSLSNIVLCCLALVSPVCSPSLLAQSIASDSPATVATESYTTQLTPRLNTWFVNSLSALTATTSSSQANDRSIGSWDNQVTVGTTAYLDSHFRNYLFATTDLEIRRRQENMMRRFQAREEDVTVRWGMSHSMPAENLTNPPLVFGADIYKQWLASDPIGSTNSLPSLLSTSLLHSEGLEVMFTLPRKGTTFCATYGRQHAGQVSDNHAIAFAVSWNW